MMSEKNTTASPPGYDPSLLGQTMFNQPGMQQQGAYPPQPQESYSVQPQYTGGTPPGPPAGAQLVTRGYPVQQQQGFPAQQQPLSPQSPQQGFAPQPAFVQTQQGLVQPQQGFAQPQQPVGAPPQFHSASPLAALGQGATPADCPICRHRAMTIVSPEVGNTTHAWAAILCFVFCLGCIPYLLTSTFDVKHKCGHCGVLLATWHRSGRTVVHAYG